MLQPGGLAAAALTGHGFAALVHPTDHCSKVAALGALAASEQPHPARLRLANGSLWALTASLLRQDRHTQLLLRLNPVRPSAAGQQAEMSGPAIEHIAIEQLPDAFVLTDDRFDLVAGNGALLDLVGLARPSEIIGLSCQSPYSKLHRHGPGNLNAADMDTDLD